MAINNNENRFAVICDWGMVFSLSACIFVLPATIAYLDSFAGLAISFYFAKKVNRMVIDWAPGTAHLNFGQKLLFIWKGFSPPPNVLNRPLQFLSLAILLSVVMSQYPMLSLLAFFGKFVKCVFLYFTFIEACNDPKRVRIFMGFFFLSAFLTVLSGIIQHYGGKDFLKGHTIGTENGVSTQRINSAFFDANGLGAYLLPVIALAVHLFFTAFSQRKWMLGGILAFFLGTLMFCLCWTLSRSSWVGYLVLAVVMGLLDRRKILLTGALVLVFIFIFLPVLNSVRNMSLIVDNLQQRAAHQEEFSHEGLEDRGSGRVAYWERAFSIIRSSPIYGTGLNTYTRVLKKRSPNPKTWLYAHNCYLQLTAETGILGLLCFLGMIFILFQYGFKQCFLLKEPWSLTVLQGCLAGLFGFLVQSFFDNTFYTVQLSMLMWMLIGLTVAVTKLKPAGD